MEQPDNGNLAERQRRRARSENSETSTTHGFSHSHTIGRKAGSEISSPKIRESCSEPTPNDYKNSYHDNSSKKQLTAQTTHPTTRERKAVVRTAWQLRELLRPLPRRRVAKPQGRIIELPHYSDVVKFVWEHRYATAFQVQQRFPLIYRSDRTCRYQLQQLSALGYLGIVPVSSTSPNFPSVYYTTRKGLAFLRSSFSDDVEIQSAVATERFRAFSRDFIQHELLTTQFDLAVLASVNVSSVHKILLHERRYFRREKQLRFEDSGKSHRIAPDSGFLIASVDSQDNRPAALKSCMMHFVEIDNGNTSLARFRKKIENYYQWSMTEANDQLNAIYSRYHRPYRRPSFRLLIVAHDQSAFGSRDDKRMKLLLQSTTRLSNAMQKRIWLTTANRLVNNVFSLDQNSHLWTRAFEKNVHKL